MRKMVFISLFFLILILSGSIFFFLSNPDHLINFVSADIDFYLHFNLNKSSYQGIKGRQWLNKFWPEEFFNYLKSSNNDFSLLGLNLSKEMLPLIDEMGLIIKGNNLVFLLKTKDSIDYPFIIRNQQLNFFSRRLQSRILALSNSEEFLQEINYKNQGLTSKKRSFTLLNNPAFSGIAAKRRLTGFIDFYFRPQRKVDFIHFLISPKKNRLCLSAKIVGLPVFSFEEGLKLFNYLPGKFVLLSPSQEETEAILSEIKKYLAWQNPIKKQTLLPDSTSFQELIVDPSYFQFREKKLAGQKIYYLEEKKIALCRINDSLLLADDLSSLEEVVQKGDFLNFQQFFYWSVNFGNIKEILLKQKGEEVKGYIEFTNKVNPSPFSER